MCPREVCVVEADRVAFKASLAQTLEFQQLWQRREDTLDGSDRLFSLLRHACDSVPYFQSINTQQSLAQNGLTDFPLTNRSLIASSRLKFLSSVINGKEHPLFARTSGTTGRPLSVRFGPVEWYELTQMSYHRIGEAFTELKELAQPGELSVLMIHDGANRQPTNTLLLELNYSMFSRVVLGGHPEDDANLIVAMRDATVPLLYAKPAYLLKLAHLDEALGSGSKRITPNLLFSSGENLYRDQRQELETRYGCRLINAYTSVEGGLIGLQCPLSEVLHIDPTRTLIEILGLDGQLHASGEGEFVLTNLWNWTMPFIRYRTGDFGVIQSTKCQCGHEGQTIARLDGRETGSFQTEAGRIDTQDLDMIFMDQGVRQFQIEQQADGSLHLFVVLDESNDDPSIEQKLLLRLNRAVRDVKVEMHLVDSIAKRGFKRRRYFSASMSRRTDTTPTLAREIAHPDPSVTIAVLQANAEYVAKSQSESIVIQSLDGEKEIRQLDLPQVMTKCLEFSPTDEVLALGLADQTVRLFNLGQPLEKVSTLKAADTPEYLAFSFDGLVLIAASRAGHLQTWQLDDESKIPFEISLPHITAVATSLVSRLAAISVSDGDSIQIRTLPDLQCFSTLATKGPANSMAFMMDENILAAGFENGRIELWTVETQKKITEFWHSSAVSHLAFCQSTQTLVAGNDRGEVRLWDVWRGHERACFQAHRASIRGIAFAVDGTGYITLGQDASLKQWPWP
jgi:phenylacetate-coenzyme A ligase PaaK-like adenylate-forming protein